MLLNLFCAIDDLCTACSRFWKRCLLTNGLAKRIKPSSLCLSEVMTIRVDFHMSRYRTFTDYSLQHVCPHLRAEFPGLVSYSRFVELMRGAVVPLLVFLRRCRLRPSDGIAFLDSTALQVCHNRRLHSHQTFRDIAQRGNTSMGGFYGFTRHLIVNHQGELVSVMLTAGHVDDRHLSLRQRLTQSVLGTLFGDRGYSSGTLFKMLFQRGRQLVTRIKKNMVNKLLPIADRLLLEKRAVVASIIDPLKHLCQMEHTRHRSPVNFLGNLFAGLIAYTFAPQKPSITAKSYALWSVCA